MAKSTPSSSSRKTPSTPQKFPLFVHKASGQWAKKIRGKTRYFGRVDSDPRGEAALQRWQNEENGKSNDGRLSVKELCDFFMSAKDDARERGRLAESSYAEYLATCTRVADVFGRHRPVATLTVGDFEKLKASFPKSWGVWRESGEIQRVRTLFRYGYEAEHLREPVRFGPAFKKPDRATMRKHRAERGPKLFASAECRKILDSASKCMKAFVLLALNGGMGNNDCGKLPCSATDLNGAFVRFPRPKTGIDRRFPLWPETVTAIREAMASGRKPDEPMFLTKYGQAWSRTGTANPLSAEFRKLVKDLGFYRTGLGFYTLRHVFRTVADETKDRPAIDLIMGHADASMGASYRETIDDGRLRAVVDHVHAWLFPSAKDEAAEGGAQ